jgi:hypothetical protein
MRTINLKYYSNLEDYNFDNGFDITQEDINGLIESEHNSLFDVEVVHITKKGNRILFKEKGYSSFFVGLCDDDNIQSGYYLRSKLNCLNDNNYQLEIYDIEEVGIDFIKLIQDKSECEIFEIKLNDYHRQLNNTNNFYISNRLGIFTNYRDFLDTKMTKDEIFNKIRTEFYNDLNNQIEEHKKQKIEEEKENDEDKKILQQIENGENFTIENGMNKYVYDISNNSMTCYYNGTKTEIVKYKSLDYFKRKIIYKLTKPTRFNISKSSLNRYVEAEISFGYYEVINENGCETIKNTIKIDFENLLFNGVKVAKGKIKFLFNRACGDWDKYKDKKYVEMLNRLSGIRVDILDMNKIEVDKLNFDISFNLIDKNTYKINFMTKDIILDWNNIKEHFVSGMSINRWYSKTSFIKMCRTLGIEEEIIAKQIKKVKILKQLGDENK